MPPFEYHRPKSLQQALELLGRARPLGGGTALTPHRTELTGVLDLQDLDLAGIEPGDGRLLIGGTLRLQALAEGIPGLPPALAQVCRQEAGWNLRNQATVAGCVVTGDGRSPLLAALLALDARIHLEPGGEQIPIEEFLVRRPGAADGRLIVALGLPLAAQLVYEGVARSPADRPLVCAAVSRLAPAPEGEWRVVLGGYGDRPIRVETAEAALSGNGAASLEALASAEQAAASAYSIAADAWASAEYRAAVAGVLVRRRAQALS
jgi:CO/xanthine dehydrogenase FAD-binding subunit